MIRRRHAQARHRAAKKAREYPYILPRRLLVAWPQRSIRINTREQSEYGADEVRVDVDALVVQVGQACEGFAVGVGSRAVAGVNMLVVLEPSGEVVPEDCEGAGGFGFEASGGGVFFVCFRFLCRAAIAG